MIQRDSNYSYADRRAFLTNQVNQTNCFPCVSNLFLIRTRPKHINFILAMVIQYHVILDVRVYKRLYITHQVYKDQRLGLMEKSLIFTLFLHKFVYCICQQRTHCYLNKIWRTRYNLERLCELRLNSTHSDLIALYH